MYIYDPSWDWDATPSGTRLNCATMLARAKQLRDKILDKKTAKTTRNGRKSKKRVLAVEAIWVGGGGNTGSDCRVMALRWILEWVRWTVGVRGVGQPDLSRFVQLDL